MRTTSVALAVLAVLTVAFASTTAFEYSQRSAVSTTTSTITVTSIAVSSTICYNPLPGTEGYSCVAGENFTISVAYSGPWVVEYQGYNSPGVSNDTTVLGSYQGDGNDSRIVTVPGLNQWTLCAEAQKLDSSDGNLTLTVGEKSSTSVPFGSVSSCDEAQVV